MNVQLEKFVFNKFEEENDTFSEDVHEELSDALLGVCFDNGSRDFISAPCVFC